MRSARTILVSALLVALAGCWGGGADVRNSNSNRSTTVGQELIDLQKAFDQGLISEREYQRTRRQILRRAD